MQARRARYWDGGSLSAAPSAAGSHPGLCFGLASGRKNNPGDVFGYGIWTEAHENGGLGKIRIGRF